MERIDTAQAKAAVLTEALPYIQDFQGSVVLVKLGGSVMEIEANLDSIMDDVAFLNAVGIKVVIVHGGGKAISRAIQASGHAPVFVEGQRVTDEATMEIVRKTLNNVVNPDLVARLCRRGANAKPLHGNWIFGAKKIVAPDRGYVGEVVQASARAVVEMLDARNLLLDELSYKGSINVYNNADGSVKVLMDGVEIINGEKYEKLYMKSSTKIDGEFESELLRDYAAYDAAVLRWTSGDEAKFSTGELKAYTDILNGNGVYATGYQNDSYGIPYYESTMDSFAHTFGNFLNYFNGAVDENGVVIDKDRLLFCTNDYKNGDAAYEDVDMTMDNIRIADTWMQDATMIGEVKNEKSGIWELSLDGNHINRLIENINKKQLDFGGRGDYEGTVYDYLLFISNRIGQNIDYYDSRHEAAFATSNALLDSRDAVSGVSETEEGINMLTYQNWYNASSRLMTALDDALDRLINNTGRVGL